MANVDFEFDFESALANAYQDDEIYNEIAGISRNLDTNFLSREKAIRLLIKVNSKVLSDVLRQYNRELLNNL